MAHSVAEKREIALAGVSGEDFPEGVCNLEGGAQVLLPSGGREYQFPDFEGTFAATIACKRWDRNKNLLAYLDFDDGRKIMTSAWSEKNYLGLADIPLNTRVSVSFQFSAKGVSYLRSVEVI